MPEPQQGPNKWLMIGILVTLLVAAVTGFLMRLPRPKLPATFVASLHVSDYDDAEGLPDLACPSLDVGTLNEDLERLGLTTWRELDLGITGSNDSNSKQGILNACDQLAKQTVDKLDTVIIHLRGHCIVSGEKTWFLAGEFSGSTFARRSHSDEIPGGALELDDLLRRLARIDAANVIVLADICDLVSAPRLGLVTNPVPAAIEKICGELEASEKGFWIITAAASLQPAHVSDLRNQTLLQAATLFALNRKNHFSSADKDDATTISLATFYEALLRYADAATRQSAPDREASANGPPQQTPLLFHAGTGGFVRGSESPLWKLAENVVVATSIPGRRPGAESTTADPDSGSKPDSKPAGESTAQRRNPLLTPTARNRYTGFSRNLASSVFMSAPVPFRKNRETAAPTPVPKTGNSGLPKQGTQEPAGEQKTDEAGQQPTAPVTPEIPDDCWMSFWKVVELLNSREVSGKATGFAPIDFAPRRWLEIQAEAIRYWRVAKINTGPARIKAEEDVKKLTETLEKLLAGILANQSVNSPSNEEILLAWNKFLAEDLAPSTGRSPWRDSRRLPKNSWKSWETQTSQWRNYVDTVSQLPGWLEWERKHPGNSLKITELITALKAWNPSQESGLLEQNLPDSEPILAIRRALRLEFDSVADEAIQKILAEQTPRLTWQDERIIADLLESPLLDYKRRKDMDLGLKALAGKPEMAIQPGTQSLVVTRQPVHEILVNISNDPTRSEGWTNSQNWIRQMNAALNWVGRDAGSSADNSSGEGNTHPDASSLAILKRMQALTAEFADRTSLNRWRTECLVANVLQPGSIADEPHCGAIPASSNDRTLYAEFERDVWQMTCNVAGSTNNSEKRQLQIRRGDGGDPQQKYSLAWRIENIPPNSRFTANDIIDLSLDDQTAIPDAPVVRSSVSVPVVIAPKIDSTPLPNGVRLLVTLSGNEAGTPFEHTTPIQVYLPNPNQVDLIVRQLWPAGPPREFRTGGIEGKDTVGPLSVPAVGELTAGEFEFLLANRSSTGKFVRLKIYAANDPPDTNTAEAGKLAIEALPPETRLMFHSGDLPVELPSGESRPVVLKTFGVEDPSKPAPITGKGKFGLVCLIEEMIPVPTDSSAGAAEVKTFRESGDTFVKYVEWQGENPYPQLVDVTDKSYSNNQVKMTVAVSSDNWDRFGLKSLPGQISLTDAAGKSLGVTVPFELKAGKLSWPVSLELPSSFRDREVYAHVTLGGYPRAINFRCDLGNALVAESTRPFVWLDLDRVTIIPELPENSKLIATPEGAPTILVFPNMTEVGVQPRKKGEKVRIDEIQIPWRMDLPAVSVTGRDSAASIELVGQQTEKREQRNADRVLTPTWTAKEDGHLLLSISATDLLLTVRNGPDMKLEGEMRLSALVRSPGMEIPPAAATLLFDTEAPRKGEVVRVSGNRDMFAGDTLVFEFSPTDAPDGNASGIAQVWFGLTRSNSASYAECEKTFDAEIQQGKLVRPPKNKTATWKYENAPWKFELTSDLLKIGEGYIGTGEWFLVARTVDFAGNVQDSNMPAVFQWRGPRPPKEEK